MEAQLSEIAMWNLVAGFLSATFVLPVIQQPRWSVRTRATVTFGWSILVGAGVVFFTGGVHDLRDPRSVVTSVLLMLVAAVSSYKGFAQPSGLAPAIEAATSPDPGLGAFRH